LERGADSSLQPEDSLPALTSCARLAALSILICSAAFGQGQGLSITNYQLVSAQTIQRTLNVTYRADLVNTGTALEAVTAIVTSLNPTVHVAAGQDTLQFAAVPANSQVTSGNTFTLQIDFNVPVDFSQLQWIFQTAGILLPANVTVTPGDTVNFPVTLGTAAPPGGVLITLASSNPTAATVSPSSFFVSQGMTSQRGVTTVTGNHAGSATITASAPGYATANGQVLVSSGGTTAMTMSFWPGSLTINGTATQNLTLNLSTPAPAGLVVNLSSSNAAVATVPATVSFGTGTTGVSVLVTGVAAGAVTITASAPNIASATASVTVTQPAAGGILLPGNVTLAPGDTVNFPVTLGTAAPAGGAFITLASSDPSIAIAWPSNLLIPEGVTSTSRTVNTVTGISAGSATITASASGYPTASARVQVTGGGTTAMTMSFSPVSLTINGTATQNLTLNLSAPAPAALVVNLSSSNATVASAPATVGFGTGMTSVAVPVTGVAAGSVTITASAPNVASATASVAVTQPAAGGILLPGNVTLAPGDTVNFPIALGTTAPAGGVFITLATSDPSIAIAWPSNLLIPEGVTSTPRTVNTVSGISAGLATITASAFGYPTASAQVRVTGGGITTTTMSFSPVSLTINGIATQNLTLNLSAPAPAALVVNLSSSNATVASVPATVSFGTGMTSVAVPVTGVAAGSVTITASAPNIASATASVTVSVTVTQPAGAILLPASATVGLNQSLALQVTLPAPAPAGGVTVSLASSDTATATVTPSVFIAARSTFSTTPPQVTGIKLGSASITASAPGFTPGSTQIQVNANGGSCAFSPAVFGLRIIAGSAQDLTLYCMPTPASGLTVSLSSSDTSVATVPSSVTYVGNSGGIPVPVTGVGVGSATITATTSSFGTATSTVTVTSLNGASVIWYGACWATLTLNGYSGNFQGIDFALSTPVPAAVQGSLFFTPNCDPSQGVDNMNDFGSLTGSTHMVQGFSRHPDTIPSSAMYWIGSGTTFGACPPGSLCSGCVTYTKATPNCSVMP
jgi:hypothetical protein